MMGGWEWLIFWSADFGETDASELCVLPFEPGARQSRCAAPSIFAGCLITALGYCGISIVLLSAYHSIFDFFMSCPSSF